MRDWLNDLQWDDFGIIGTPAMWLRLRFCRLVCLLFGHTSDSNCDRCGVARWPDEPLPPGRTLMDEVAEVVGALFGTGKKA